MAKFLGQVVVDVYLTDRGDDVYYIIDTYRRHDLDRPFYDIEEGTNVSRMYHDMALDSKVIPEKIAFGINRICKERL